MRYIKKIDDNIVEYTGPALGGDKWYINLGYLPYDGDLPVARLDVENGTVIERAVAKYDYIIAKYNPDGTNDDYINYLEREIEPMSAYADALPEGQANESLLLVSALIVCSLAAGVGYLFYRKRRHQA